MTRQIIGLYWFIDYVMALPVGHRLNLIHSRVFCLARPSIQVLGDMVDAQCPVCNVIILIPGCQLAGFSF